VNRQQIGRWLAESLFANGARKRVRERGERTEIRCAGGMVNKQRRMAGGFKVSVNASSTHSRPAAQRKKDGREGEERQKSARSERNE